MSSLVAFRTNGAQTGTTTPLNISVTTIAGDTIVVFVGFNNTSGAAVVTSVTGGGQYYPVGWPVFPIISGVCRIEAWATLAKAGGPATTVVVNFAGGPVTDAGSFAACYSNVNGIPFGTAFVKGFSGTGANPALDFSTSDRDSFVTSFFAFMNGNAVTAGGVNTVDGIVSVGTLRQADANVSISDGLVDNTTVSPGFLRTRVTHGAVQWGGAGVELWPSRQGGIYQSGILRALSNPSDGVRADGASIVAGVTADMPRLSRRFKNFYGPTTAAPPATTIMRRTLYHLGARTGSRRAN